MAGTLGAGSGVAWTGGCAVPCSRAMLALLLLCVSGCLHLDPLALLSLPTATASRGAVIIAPAPAPSATHGMPQDLSPGAPAAPSPGASRAKADSPAAAAAPVRGGAVSPAVADLFTGGVANRTDLPLLFNQETNPLAGMLSGKVSSELESAAASLGIALPILADPKQPEPEGSKAFDDPSIDLSETRLSGPGTGNLTLADMTNSSSNASFSLPVPAEGPQAFQGGNWSVAPAPSGTGSSGTGLTAQEIEVLQKFLEQKMPDLVPKEQEADDETYDGALVVVTDGNPAAKLDGKCRTDLAAMFHNSSDCNAHDVARTCTSVVVTIYEWKMLCLSGLYTSKAETLFTPDKPGLIKLKWGTTAYMELLGKLTAQLNTTTENKDQTLVFEQVKKSATLGPVLEALVKRALASKRDPAGSVLLSWALSLSELIYPLPKEQMARLVLGGVALEKAKRKFSFDSVTIESTTEEDDTNLEGNVEKNGGEGTAGRGAAAPSPARASDSAGSARRSTLETPGQFIVLPFRTSATKGAGFSKDFKLVTSNAEWCQGSLPTFNFTKVQMEENSKVSCNSEEVAETLQVSGSGSFNGAVLEVSVSASFFDEKMDKRTGCVSVLTRRVSESGVELVAWDPKNYPKLSATAIGVLNATGGVAAFEGQYGEYFVLATLKAAQFDGMCSSFSEESKNNMAVKAGFKAKYNAFSAEMDAQWTKAKETTKFNFACQMSLSGSCQPSAKTSIGQVRECANTVTTETGRDKAYKMVLMRYSSLPDYERVKGRIPPPEANTRFDLLGYDFRNQLQRTWARAKYLTTTTAEQLRDWERKAFFTDLQRVMDVLNALASNRPITAESSAKFFDDLENTVLMSAVSAPNSSLVTLSPPQFTDNALTSATVGPGLIVELVENKDNSGRRVLLGGNIWSLAALVEGFDNAVSHIRVEAIQNMTQWRMSEVLDAVKADLYRMEVKTSYLGLCYTTYTKPDRIRTTEDLDKHDVSCPAGEVLQRYQLNSNNQWWYDYTLWWYDFTCCRLAPLAKDSYKEMWSTDFRVLNRHFIQCYGGWGGLMSSVKLVTQYTQDRLWNNCVDWNNARYWKHDDWCQSDHGGYWGDNGATCRWWGHYLEGAEGSNCAGGFGKGKCRYGGSCCKYDYTCTVPVDPWPEEAQAKYCRVVTTPIGDAGNGNPKWLNQFNVQCNWDEVLSYTQILDKGSNQAQIGYTCCGMPR